MTTTEKSTRKRKGIPKYNHVPLYLLFMLLVAFGAGFWLGVG